MAGFECATFLWKDGERKANIALTGHDRHLQDDYRRVEDLGIDVAREAIRWPLVDKGRGRYDWSTVDSLLDALNELKMVAIWDLGHDGFPDGCDLFTDDCIRRLADYCRAAAEHVNSRGAGPHCYTPVNEITFFSGGGTDLGGRYPFARGKYNEFEYTLCRLDIAGVKAIREVDSKARMVHVEPIGHHVPHPEHPHLTEPAWEKAYEEAYEAWDTLAGRRPRRPRVRWRSYRRGRRCRRARCLMGQLSWSWAFRGGPEDDLTPAFGTPSLPGGEGAGG